MSTQSDALLALVSAHADLNEGDAALLDGDLWGNPVICTPLVFEQAEEDAEPPLLERLRKLREHGLIVVADDPQRERTRLANLRPGYMNRAERRKFRRGKPGKHK